MKKLQQSPERANLVLAEALRLYPPALVITRLTLSEINVEGITIPADSLVIVSPWLVHRNQKTLEQPLKFLPDRFKAGTPQLGYIPFGAGARLCIGRDMAILEGSMILAQLAQHWNIEAIHNSQVPIDASVTLRPVGGMPVRISRKI